MSLLADQPAAAGPLDAKWLAASEHLNPILVKEVRQALRGPNFRRAYIGVLAVAGAFGIWQLLAGYNSGNWGNIGERLFLSQYWALSIGLCALLPIQAYQTLGTELEEHTLELLQLSGLSPGQIVNGKLTSVLAQGLVVLSAFLPLIALSYLLRGVDLFAILIMVPVCILASSIACSVAAFLSANIEKRMQRVLGIAVVAFGGVALTFGLGTMASQASREFGNFAQDTEALFGAVITAIGGACVAALFLAGARAAFAHPEEDGLRTLRRVTVISVGLACALALVSLAWPRLDDGMPLIMLLMMGMLLAPVFLFLMTDRGRMGRHATEHLRGGGRGWLPMLPGGGLGVLLYLCVALAVGGVFAVLIAMGAGITGEDWWLAVTPMGYMMLYIGVPSALLASYTATAAGRIRVRLAVVIFGLGCILVPMVLGGFSGDRDLASGQHYLNFFWAMSDDENGVGWAGAFGLVGLLLNLPRILRAREAVGVLRWARRSRALPSNAAAESEPPRP